MYITNITSLLRYISEGKQYPLLEYEGNLKELEKSIINQAEKLLLPAPNVGDFMNSYYRDFIRDFVWQHVSNVLFNAICKGEIPTKASVGNLNIPDYKGFLGHLNYDQRKKLHRQLFWQDNLFGHLSLTQLKTNVEVVFKKLLTENLAIYLSPNEKKEVERILISKTFSQEAKEFLVRKKDVSSKQFEAFSKYLRDDLVVKKNYFAGLQKIVESKDNKNEVKRIFQELVTGDGIRWLSSDNRKKAEEIWKLDNVTKQILFLTELKVTEDEVAAYDDYQQELKTQK